MNHENVVPILDETQYSLKCLEECVDAHKKFRKEIVVQEGAVLSVVVPIFNEQDSIELLHERIVTACQGLGKAYEIIFVDDGSQDGTVTILRDIVKRDSTVKVVRFRKNFGQTAAMDAGFQVARGEVIVSMDGDMQNDPADIPLLLEKMDEGYDVVCGWRKNRQDKFLSRRLPSIVANWIIGLMTGVKIRDNGCSLKAYRSAIIKKVALYGDLHRFIPAMSAQVGARITEIAVTHHPRRFGKSKYGIGRAWRVLLDMVKVKMITSFSSRPGLWFGFLYGPVLMAGLLIAIFSCWLYVTSVGEDLLNIATVAFLLLSLGGHLLSMGIVGELLLNANARSRGTGIRPTFTSL